MVSSFSDVTTLLTELLPIRTSEASGPVVVFFDTHEKRCLRYTLKLDSHVTK